MKVMIDGYLSDNGIGRCPHKGVKATNVVSSGASIGIYRLLSSWMVDQTTLGRVSLRCETMLLVKEGLSNFFSYLFFVDVIVNRLLAMNKKKTLVIVNKLVEDSRRDIEKAVENEEELRHLKTRV